MEDCVYYLGNGCRIFGKCDPVREDANGRCCLSCTSILRLEDSDFSKKWIDPLEVTDVRGTKTDALRHMLQGRPSFLVCGGPSAKPYLSELNRRGVFSLAVNNAAGNTVRPQAFVCSDPPVKFSHSIWLDPGVMKFVPSPKLSTGRRGRLRRKEGNEFYECGTSGEAPNVWGFKRNSWMTMDEQFFTESGAGWGNLNEGVKKTGESKTVCTMLLGLRLLYYLGSRRIYLVGVDFRMTPNEPYSFEQGKHGGGCDSNNHQFEVVNGWLTKMQERGVFSRFGLELYNCYERSGLRAFPYVPFESALEDAVGYVEEEPDLSDWYEKEDCPKCGSWNVTIIYNNCECRECRLKWCSGERPQYEGRGKRRRLVK